MKKILFDESHQELLHTQAVEDDPETDKWDRLRGLLEDQGWEIGVLQGTRGSLTPEALSDYDLLVLAAPTEPLLPSEIKAIQGFVSGYRSLLVANNTESLWRQNSNSMEVLLEPYGVQFERSRYCPAQEIVTFYPHYISTNVGKSIVGEPTYLEVVTNRSSIIAKLENPEKPFLAAIDGLPGKTVVIGDFVILGDRTIDQHDNQRLTLNIFQWLMNENPLDCREVQMPESILFGHPGTFSIVLINPQPQRAEKIRCLLESDSNAVIENPTLRIRTIPAGGQTWLQWVIEPKRLGYQKLRLTIDYPKGQKKEPLFFDPVARFDCAPDARIDLVFVDNEGKTVQTVETDMSFNARAVVDWSPDARQTPLNWDLQFPNDHFSLLSEPVDETESWQLKALAPGDSLFTLRELKTEQSYERLLRVRTSKQLEIDKIRREIAAPLDARIHLLLAQLRPHEFDTEDIRQIPFRIITPEEFVQLIYPSDTARRLLTGLDTIRAEMQINRPLLKELLRYIAPIYSPIEGACIPFDPDLASRLAEDYPSYSDNLSLNLLTNREKDPLWLEQNLAAFLLHEKYGHGFFYAQSTLGRQLSMLYKYGFLQEEDRQQLPAPYPRVLGTEYAQSIQALNDSSIIVNEGFAAWMELAFLPKLSPAVGQAAYRRRDFLLNRDKGLERLAKNSSYFRRFSPFKPPSRYYEGYSYFRLIQGYFGDLCGPKCVVQAMLKASDINVGVVESDGFVMFGLSAAALEEALLESRTDDARADMRLRLIHRVLREYQEEVREEQRRLQCYRVCLHKDCPVNKVIRNQLTW